MGGTQSVRSYYRMCVVVRYPREINGRINSFHQEHFANLLKALRKSFPDYDITLSASAYDHFCRHSSSIDYCSEESDATLPTLLVEVCSTVQPSTAQGEQLVDAVSSTLNVDGQFHVEAIYNQSLKPF